MLFGVGWGLGMERWGNPCFKELNVDLITCVWCSKGEEEVEETPTEMLYLGMLPNLSQYVVSTSEILHMVSVYIYQCI